MEEERSTVEVQETTQESAQPEPQTITQPEPVSYFDREARRMDEVIPLGDEPEEQPSEPVAEPPPPQETPALAPEAKKPRQAVSLDELVRRDPGLGQVVGNYLRQRMGFPQQPTGPGLKEKFEVKPISEYDDEAAWLKDHMQRYRKHVLAEADARHRLQMQQYARATYHQQRIEAIRAALFARDPEHAATVIPKLEEYGKSLSPDRLQKINSYDMGEIVRFYDEVKSKIVGQQQQKQPQWRVRSSRAMASTPPSNSPWNMSKEEFEAKIAEAKGY